jgi:hypothetical protein
VPISGFATSDIVTCVLGWWPNCGRDAGQIAGEGVDCNVDVSTEFCRGWAAAVGIGHGAMPAINPLG